PIAQRVFGERPGQRSERFRALAAAGKEAALDHVVSSLGEGPRTRICAMSWADGSRISHTMHSLPSSASSQPLRSGSHHVTPCRYDDGNAWWLFCSPSPKVMIATSQLFALRSLV